jgi:hypothetical protein
MRRLPESVLLAVFQSDRGCRALALLQAEPNVEAMNFSGMGQAEYGAALGLSLHSLRIWRDRLGESGDFTAMGANRSRPGTLDGSWPRATIRGTLPLKHPTQEPPSSVLTQRK